MTVVDLEAVARLDDPSFYVEDPYPAFARLRHEAPVFWYEPGGFWAVSRYGDIQMVSASSNARRFSVEQGVHFRIKQHPEIQQAMTMGGEFLFATDPPRHAEFRRLLHRAFTGKALERMEPLVRSIVRETLAQVPVGETIDFVKFVSDPIPVAVIAELFGVPAEDRANLIRWGDSLLIDFGQPVMPEITENQVANFQEAFGYFAAHLDERVGQPRDDLFSTLANLQFEGGPLPPLTREFVCFTLLSAGNETTRHTITGGALALGEYPEQWELIRQQPGLCKRAAQEIVRWHPAILNFGRTATEDTVIRDQKVRAGDYITLLYPAANRDEEIYGDTAETFDVTRGARNLPMSFGSGEHFCLGAMLALMEIEILVEELAATFERWELAGDPVRQPSTCFNIINHLPVVFHRR